MKITSKLIDFNSYSYFFKESKISPLLITAFLHKENKINHQKMMAMFGGIKDETLLKKRNTYHCKINNKWYSDEPMMTILREAFEDVCPNGSSMTFEDFLQYVSLYLNKPRNYCIDFIQSEIVEPIVNSYSEYNRKYVESFGLESAEVNTTKYEWYEPTGYCCADHDGDYDTYKSWQYQRYVLEANQKAYRKAFTDYLHKQKKKYKCFTIPRKELK
jgi:hypothetical protein